MPLGTDETFLSLTESWGFNMASKRLKRSIQRTALSAALGLCLAGGVYAQSNANGSLFGRADAGSTVVVEDPSTGVRREISVQADGTYRASQLPIGNYRVTMKRADGTETVREGVRVSVGTGTPVNFAGGGADATLGTISVTSNAINPIDVSSVESTTILSAERIEKIPVSRDTTSVALLAPGTVKGDAAFGNLASFGGSSVAENQYFFNGFNITNTFQNLNFVQVPFEAIAEQQTKTGGYGAEFGRSTGGVVNQISRRGTNDFHAGGSFYWTPSELTETFPDLYDTAGNIIDINKQDKGWNYTLNAWAGGALIQDTLFAYGLVSWQETSSTTYTGGGNNTVTTSEQPKWLVKLDWNINEDNLLEFTALSDKRSFESALYTEYTVGGEQVQGPYVGTSYNDFGGEAYILKYTGYLTDNFTLSALAGHSQSDRGSYSVTSTGIVNEYYGTVGQGASGCPWIIDARPGVPTAERRTGCYIASTLGRPDAGDTRDQFRVDAEWSLGSHLIRGGVDIDNFESVAGNSYSGGEYWRYYSDTSARRRVFQSGSTVSVDQTAFYLEDSWNITDNFIFYGGLRWDTFDNKNGNGESYVKIKNQFAPRLGFSWDVNGDSTLKVFGNAGRYALPLTATVAVRGASQSLFTQEFYTYTEIDPVTNAPIDPVAVPGTFRYLNNEFGVGKNPETIASQNLDPMYQDEYILGFQKQLTDNFSVGVRGIYRDLKRAIDDTCDYRPIIQWAYDNGFTGDGGVFITPDERTQDSDIAAYNPGFAFCHLYNPGNDVVFRMDINGDGQLETVNIGADEVWEEGNAFGITPGVVKLGPKAKRTYKAIEVFFEGNWDKFFLQGSYTWAQNKGNTEGGVKSDIGQADTGTTQDFDYPELAEGSYGFLPNDRRHTLKLFGNYLVNDEWSVGANLLVQSGRPENCFGYHPVSPNYLNSYFYCGGELVPRGTAGRTPWTKSVDMNVRYAPAFADGNLAFKIDVFNIFNADGVTAVDEAGEDSNGAPRPLYYLTPTNWQAPRSVRFSVQYDF